MTGPFDDFDRQLDQVFNRLREGTAGAKDMTDLEEILRSDPALRARYRARVRLEEELSAHFEEPEELVPPFEQEKKRPFYRYAVVASIGIAAAIAVLAALGIFEREEPVTPVAAVATLENRSSGSWEIPPKTINGSRVLPGEVRLESGLAFIRFDSGATVTLEGPAALMIETSMRAKLLSGKALINAPESAHGFAIILPHGETVDLGTRFSVVVNENDATCEVLEGRVMMKHESNDQKEYLENGQVMIMNQEGMEPLEYRPSMSFSPDDKKPQILRSSHEATVVLSNVREGYIDDRLLLVKMETNSNFQRRALFNIDLGEARGREIKSAQLNLNLVPSGLGFAAYLPETITFAIYGITDKTNTRWTGANPQWEDTPGFVAEDENAVNLSEVTLLDKIEINRGQQRGQFKIKSEELRNFVQSDTTGTAGFLIVRETYALDDYSLVHAFASSQHPEARGPSLEVIFAKPE